MQREMQTLALSVIAVGVWFLLTTHLGLNMADEGYLWHNTLRVLQGGVPIRDFRSYDPGRYYWTALWGLLLGDGILALRVSGALFQLLGVWAGLCALARATSRTWLLASFAFVLTVWMFPRYKIYEYTLVLIAVLVAVRVTEKPTPSRHVAAGALVGLAAFFGKNLGAYSLWASPH